MSYTEFQANAFGEISTSFQARRDLPAFSQGLAYCLNWLPYSIGGTLYRPGFKYIGNTRRYAPGVLKRFVYDEQLSYTLCFTDGNCRFLDNGSVSLEDEVGISEISTADPAIVTTDAPHGFASGSEVFVYDVKNMPEVNNRFFTITSTGAQSFSLHNIQFTDGIDTTGFPSSATAGKVSAVVDIPSPYGEEDLPFIKRAQKAKAVYFVDALHEPQYFSYDEALGWLFLPYTRTADPFTQALTAVSNTSPRVFTIGAAKAYETDEVLYLRGLGGATALNDKAYRVDYLSSTTFTLRDFETDAVVNAGAAWTSGGHAAFVNDQPSSVGFYGGRLWFGGTANDPNVFWGSRGPDSNGLPRFDDFTRGPNADDSIRFSIQAQNDTIEFIRFFAGTPKFLAIGALGGIYKATGLSGDGSAITNTSINVAPVDYLGVADLEPVYISSELYYVQRGKRALNQFGFDFYKDNYVSKELSLYSDEIISSDLQAVTRHRWVSDLIWGVLASGEALVMSSKANENQGFARITTPNGSFLDFESEASEDRIDELYAVIEREIDGETRRYIETFARDPEMVRRESFASGDKDEDDYSFALATVWAQRQYVRMDSAVTYDGTQDTTLVLDLDASPVTATVGEALFYSATARGKIITARFPTGKERGLAKVLSYVSDTVVEVEILEEFSSASLASGEWELSTNTLYGFDHLEGKELRILADGGRHSAKRVVDGKITLDDQFSYVIGGLGYDARMKTNAINQVIDSTGTLAVGFTSTIDAVAFKYRNTVGLKFGFDLYDLIESEEFSVQEYNSLPPLLKASQHKEPAFQGHNQENQMWIVKDDALPADILSMHFSGTVGGV